MSNGMVSMLRKYYIPVGEQAGSRQVTDRRTSSPPYAWNMAAETDCMSVKQRQKQKELTYSLVYFPEALTSIVFPVESSELVQLVTDAEGTVWVDEAPKEKEEGRKE